MLPEDFVKINYKQARRIVYTNELIDVVEYREILDSGNLADEMTAAFDASVKPFAEDLDFDSLSDCREWFLEELNKIDQEDLPPVAKNLMLLLYSEAVSQAFSKVANED